MKNKNLKLYAVPIIYAFAIIMFGTSMIFIQKIINNKKIVTPEIMEYVNSEIVTDNEYIPVVSEIPTILKPFLNGDVKINKTFYNYEDESQNQENSLIFYEDTYMQNSGTAYTHPETFDVISVLDGTIIEVTENELLGKTIKIRHNNDLVSTYGCLSETKVNQDENVLRGQVIGIGGACGIYSKNFNLHFELSYQGKNIDPEQNYHKTADEL